MNKEDELCKESLSEVNTRQETRALHTELQPFKSETEKVMKSLQERCVSSKLSWTVIAAAWGMCRLTP